MSAHDYSGVHADGQWFGRAGWSFFSVGVLFALCGAAYAAAIVVVVVLYALSLRGM